MGASESKVAFKEGVFRLSREDNIPIGSAWWDEVADVSLFQRLHKELTQCYQMFIEFPESGQDVQELWSPNDLRALTLSSESERPPLGTQVRPKQNVETLIYRITRFLLAPRPNDDSNSATVLGHNAKTLNAVRILARILPYLYEAEHLTQWEARFFWHERTPAKERDPNTNRWMYFDGIDGDKVFQESEADAVIGRPLGHVLLDRLLDCLFSPTLTLPERPDASVRPQRVVWQSGIGSTRGAGMTKENEKAATEVLRLLTVLSSRPIYMSQGLVAGANVDALTYLTTSTDRETVLPLTCSLLNTVLKYNANTWSNLPIDLNAGAARDHKQIMTTSCLQFLLVLVTYPVPDATGSDGSTLTNEFRKALGRLHRPEHFQFLEQGLRNILMQPAQGVFTPLTRLTSSALPIAPETLALFWELVQCNKRFRSYLIETGRSVDFVILVLYYAVDGRENPAKQNVVRMCIFILQTLSAEDKFGLKLNQPFLMWETLPPSLQIQKFHGSYADFLISHLHTLLTSGNVALESSCLTILTIINNIAPELRDLQRATSSKLLDIFVRFSTPAFLFANETNHILLSSILESINAILKFQHHENRRFVDVLTKSKSRLSDLQNLSVDELKEDKPYDTSTNSCGDDDLASLASEDDSGNENGTPMVERMSAKAKGKQRVGSPIGFDTSNSTLGGPSQVDDGRSGQPGASPVVPLLTSQTLAPSSDFKPTNEWLHTWQPFLDLYLPLQVIEHTERRRRVEQFAPPATPGVAAPTSSETPVLEKMPWETTGGDTGDEARKQRQGFKWTTQSLGWYIGFLWGLIYASDASMNRGSNAIWAGTNIKLFSVLSQRHDISLKSPKGAVDAAGDAIAQRISSFSFTKAPTMREV